MLCGIGVGAGKRGCKGFSPEFPKHARKNFGPLFVRIFSISDDLGFWVPFSQIKAHWAPFLSNQSQLSTIFDRIFIEFAQIFKDFAKVFTDFGQICTDIARIFKDFAQIFYHRFWGVLARPVASPPSPLLCVMRCGKTHFLVKFLHTLSQ